MDVIVLPLEANHVLELFDSIVNLRSCYAGGAAEAESLAAKARHGAAVDDRATQIFFELNRSVPLSSVFAEFPMALLASE